MTVLIDRLRTLTVRDVMAHDPVQASAGQPMPEVADVLLEHNISGVPVVDEEGRIVGMLSALDFVKRDRPAADGDFPSPGAREHRTPHAADERTMKTVDANDRVGAFMSRGVQSISPCTSLIKAARMMAAQHVHRLPVIDEHERCIGMLTSMDLVATIVNAVDEQEKESV